MSIGSSSITSNEARVDFLQLLTVQLQNQDPVDPVDQEGLINDLAQFSQLEGLENLNASFGDLLRLQEITQGTNLVGRDVSFTNAQGDLETGRVDEFFTSGSNVQLLVNGTALSLDDIVSVTNQQIS